MLDKRWTRLDKNYRTVQNIEQQLRKLLKNQKILPEATKKVKNYLYNGIIKEL